MEYQPVLPAPFLRAILDSPTLGLWALQDGGHLPQLLDPCKDNMWSLHLHACNGLSVLDLPCTILPQANALDSNESGGILFSRLAPPT